MPFDNPPGQNHLDVPALIPNTLAAIGIQPVPHQIVQEHKSLVLERYAAIGPYQAQLIAEGHAFWTKRQLASRAMGNDWFPREQNELPFGDLQYEPNFRVIKRQLSNSVTQLMTTPDQTAAPAEIIKVAATVHRNIWDAKFTVEYFYDDPILNVTYCDLDGTIHDECLGIWDHGRIIAIAGMPDRKPWYSRLLKFVG